nr:hypothetical protein [Tanacetum cinerariifolium]
MTTKSQQSALDNALIILENQRVIGKCNMRINPVMKPNKPFYQVVLDALALTTCYHALLITAEVLVIYMHQFWDTVNKHNASYRFKIDNKRFCMNVEVFRDILNICPRVLGQEFNEPPSEEEALSFIRELGNSREINYITNVIVDHLHQPWRNFASIINKYLCGKDLAYQIDNKDSKKQDKMLYPIFIRIIIHYFLTKDKSISMRKRKFMHTARDDSLLGTMRFVSRHEDTQVVKPLKSKKPKRKSDLAISSKETPSKKKPTKAKKDVPSTKKPATKPKLNKKKARVKADRGKEVPNEQQRKTLGTNKGTGTEPGVPDVPKYDYESNKVSWGDSGEEDDDDEDDTKDDEGNDDGDGNDDDDDSDHKRSKSDRDEDPNLNQFNEEHKEEEEVENVDEFINKEDDEKNEEELDDGEELYKDVNMNLKKEDVEMTNDDQGGADQHNKTEGPMQSSSLSSDFTKKLLNIENVSPADNEIASLMDTTYRNEEPSGQTSTLFTVPITILPKAVLDFATPVIEQNITESLEAVVLAKSSSQPKSTYEAAASLLEYEFIKILLDKMEECKSHLRTDYKRELYDVVVKSYNTEKDLFETYGEVFTLKMNQDEIKIKTPLLDQTEGRKEGSLTRKSSHKKIQGQKEGKSSRSFKDTSCSHHNSSGKSAYAEEPSHTVDDFRVQKNQEFYTGNNDEQPEDEAAPKND